MFVIEEETVAQGEGGSFKQAFGQTDRLAVRYAGMHAVTSMAVTAVPDPSCILFSSTTSCPAVVWN